MLNVEDCLEYLLNYLPLLMLSQVLRGREAENALTLRQKRILRSVPASSSGQAHHH